MHRTPHSLLRFWLSKFLAAHLDCLVSLLESSCPHKLHGRQRMHEFVPSQGYWCRIHESFSFFIPCFSFSSLFKAFKYFFLITDQIVARPFYIWVFACISWYHLFLFFFFFKTRYDITMYSGPGYGFCMSCLNFKALVDWSCLKRSLEHSCHVSSCFMNLVIGQYHANLYSGSWLKQRLGWSHQCIVIELSCVEVWGELLRLL